MKKFISTLFLALLTAASWAFDAYVDGIYYNLNSTDKTAEVTWGPIDYSDTVEIPESITYDGVTYAVTSIGENAFIYCTSVTSVTIPNSVTSIGKSAFPNCSGLKSVVIGNSVESIGESAFYECTGLTSVTIPNSVSSIGESAFKYCRGLKSLVIGNSVESIGGSAFAECTGLISGNIYVEATTPPTCDGYPVFYSLDVIFNGVYWEEYRRYIYDTAILHVPKGTKDLYSTADDWKEFNLIVEDSDIDIDGIYYNLYSDDKTAEVASGEVKYTGNVVIPESVTYEGETYTVTSIGQRAFYKCEGLTSVDIPNSVTSIGERAFSWCTAMTSITIPNSVTRIVERAFDSCKGLISFDIPNSVTSIGQYTFYGCSSLKSVTIPNSVTSIGKSAFYGCSSLKSVTIPNSVTSIERYTFGYCPLESVTIPNSVTSIGDYAFCACMHLKSLEIGNSVVSIGEGAFVDCDGLTSVTFPSSVTEIGCEAFYGCSGFTSIYVLADTPPYCYYSAFGSSYLGDDTFYDRVTLHVVKGTKALYSNAYQWMNFKNITDDLTSGIEEVSGSEVSGTRKFLHNGRVIIEKNGKQFTIDGAEIK